MISPEEALQQEIVDKLYNQHKDRLYSKFHIM